MLRGLGGVLLLALNLLLFVIGGRSERKLTPSNDFIAAVLVTCLPESFLNSNSSCSCDFSKGVNGGLRPFLPKCVSVRRARALSASSRLITLALVMLTLRSLFLNFKLDVELLELSVELAFSLPVVMAELDLTQLSLNNEVRGNRILKKSSG